MKDKFNQFPKALQKQVLIRLTASAVSMLMLVLILLYRGGFELVLPCVGFAAVFLISAFQLYVRCEENEYVVLHGVCTEIERTGLRRRVKDIYVKENEHTVRLVRPTMKLRALNVGDKITIYLADNAPVYDMDGCKVICNTLAVEKEF